MSDTPGRRKFRRLADAFSDLPPAAAEVLEQGAPPLADPLAPSVSLLAKLGFIAVRACSMLKEDEPMFERLALDRLLNDKEVTDWIDHMASHGYIPKRP